MDPVYLDNNATTRTDPAVVQAMLPFFTEQFGNASSMHAFGMEVGSALSTAASPHALVRPGVHSKRSQWIINHIVLVPMLDSHRARDRIC